jgi:putative heme-binding domain-containing protein
MYALEGLDELDEQIILKRLSDDHPQVRRHATRLAEQLPASEALCRRLVRLSDDDSLAVRCQLAFTIGSIDCKDRISVLAALIARDPDDVWMQTAVQSSLADGAGALFAAAVQNPQFRSASAGRFLSKLASQIGQQNREADIRLAIAAIPTLPESDAAFALPVIGELVKTRGRSGSLLRELSSAGELKAIDTIAAKMIRSSVSTAADDSIDATKRIAAINALSFGALDDVEPTLVSLIDNRQPHGVQQAAITTLGKFNSARVAGPLLEAWRSLSPRLRETTTEVLFARSERTLALFDAVDADVIAVGSLAKSRLQVAAKSKNSSVKSRAAKYLESAGSKRRGDVVQAYSDALELSGDVQRGRALFGKECSVCHKVEGIGHEMGPNLATMKSRGPETILVNVLDPNREVNPQYLNYVVLTEDGRAMTGMIAAESATSITLRRAESSMDTVLRVDIDQLQSTGLSIMPEGMEEKIDKQSMADLIAYLMQVK